MEDTKKIEEIVEKKARQIYLAQKRKEKMIEEQNRKKENSMRVLSVQRDAVQIYCVLKQLYKDDLKDEHFEQAIKDVLRIKSWLKAMLDVGDEYTFSVLKDYLKKTVEAKRRKDEAKIEEIKQKEQIEPF